MQKTILLIVCMVIFSCNTTKNYPPATDALTAGIAFIDACLKGNFEKANYYMLQDDENKKLLQQAKQKYTVLTKQEKQQLQQASLQNFTIENTTATEAIINYTNSYNKQPGKIKVKQQQNIWLADFKYSFNPNL